MNNSQKIISSYLFITNWLLIIFLHLGGCVRKQFNHDYWLITAGGHITDHGFNSVCYRGIDNYVQQVVNPHDHIHASFYEPANTNRQAMLQALKAVNIYNAQTAVLAGFQWTSPEYLHTIARYIPKNIIVDSGASIIPSNITCLVFNSEIAGFLGALCGALYFNYQHQKPVFATYGGLPVTHGVSNYMWGFLCGISFWNYVTSVVANSVDFPLVSWWKQLFASVYQRWDQQQHQVTNHVNHAVQLATLQGKVSAQGAMNGFVDDFNHWFTGSFHISDRSKVLSEKLLSQGANCIFPVAGTQIADTLSEMNKKGYENCRLIGTLAQQRTNLNTNRILVSAVKKISQAVFDALVAIKLEVPGDKQNHFLGKVVHGPLQGDRWKWTGLSAVPEHVAGSFYQDIVTLLERGITKNDYQKHIAPIFSRLVTFYQAATRNHATWSETYHYCSQQAPEQIWGKYLLKHY